jgi:hypothetical protein
MLVFLEMEKNKTDLEILHFVFLYVPSKSVAI